MNKLEVKWMSHIWYSSICDRVMLIAPLEDSMLSFQKILDKNALLPVQCTVCGGWQHTQHNLFWLFSNNFQWSMIWFRIINTVTVFLANFTGLYWNILHNTATIRELQPYLAQHKFCNSPPSLKNHSSAKLFLLNIIFTTSLRISITT